MTWKQRLSVAAMVLLGASLVAVAVRMVLARDYGLWAVELALLCAFAVALRAYALEWRRQRDQRNGW